MIRSSFGACLAALPLCALAAPPQYAVTDLGLQVTGEGLLWQPDPLSVPCTPAPPNFPGLGGGNCIYASIILSSSSSVYVGVSGVPGQGTHAARWVQSSGTTTFTDIGLLPNAKENSAPPSAYALSLNRVGDVVGQSDAQYTSNAPNDTGYVDHGFLWNNGVLTDLRSIAGNNYYSLAEGVNDSHEVVGWTNTLSSANGQVLKRAFIYVGGAMYNLTFYLVGGPTVLLSEATAIDCQGNIAALGTPASGGSTHTYLLVRQGAPRTNCPQQ